MRQPPAHALRGRPVLALAAVLAAAVALLVLPAAPAGAHDVLVGTDPADGAVLDAAPTQVVLTFSSAQAEVGAEVLVTGPDGATWSQGAAVVAGTTVTQALAPGLPDGPYTVTWRSVAGDGHPVTGSFAFTLDVPDAPAPSPEPTATPPDEDRPAEATATPDPPALVAEAPDAGEDAGASDPEGTDGGWVAYVVGAALLVAVAATLLVVRGRRSRRG